MTLLTNNRGKLPILIMIVVLVVALAGTGFLLFKKGTAKKGDHEEKPAKAAVHEKETLVPLQEFILNLADKDQERYVKLEISLGMHGLEHAGGGGHGDKGSPLGESEPVVRDAIISAVGKCYYSDLLTNDGKETLKAKIKTAIKQTGIKAEVANVYFTNFAMQ